MFVFLLEMQHEHEREILTETSSQISEHEFEGIIETQCMFNTVAYSSQLKLHIHVMSNKVGVGMKYLYFFFSGRTAFFYYCFF